MTKEQAKSLFMDYLYGELHENEKKELEMYLASHPELKQELDELQDVRSVLSHYPVEEPAAQMIMIPAQRAGFKKYWQDFIQIFLPQNEVLRTAYAVAVCLILIIAMGAIFNLQINYNSSGFALAFGAEETSPEEALTSEQFNYLVEQVKTENALLMAEFIQAAQEQQNQNIETAFNEFARFMNQQRMSDLQLISSDLNTLEASYYSKFRETDRVLGEIIQTVQTN